jgi:hypothetical protein
MQVVRISQPEQVHRGLFRSTCRQEKHFAFSKSEFGKTAIWADQEFWKYQNGRPGHIFQPGKMDVNLSIELFLVVRSASLAVHTTPRTLDWLAIVTARLKAISELANVRNCNPRKSRYRTSAILPNEAQKLIAEVAKRKS